MAKKFNHIFWMLTEEETDIINVLLHIIEKHDDILNPPEDRVELELNRRITTNMHEISASLGYTELNINTIIRLLDSITKNVATIYYDIDGGRQMEKGTFLNKYTVSSIKNDINKRITLWISSDITAILQEHKKLFDAFYKHAKYELKSRYAKMIYDYFSNKGGTELFTIANFGKMMDYDLVATSWDWSRLNSNILKRAIGEINKNTDMQIEYEKVKTSEGGRTQTTHVEFNFFTAKDGDKVSEYFDQETLVQRRVLYYIEKHIQEKYTTLLQFKDKNAIANPTAYKDKMRKEAMRNIEEFKAMINVQEWSNVIKYEWSDYDGLVGLMEYDGRPFVTINNDYKLYDPELKEELSTSARDTMKKIESFLIDKDGRYTIYEIENIKNCSISYSKG